MITKFFTDFGLGSDIIDKEFVILASGDDEFVVGAEGDRSHDCGVMSPAFISEFLHNKYALHYEYCSPKVLLFRWRHLLPNMRSLDQKK